ncbi:MAG: hypothetical protein JNM00_09765 [Flavobacteriales bacterium]|nr:hypothetical protein [Flavobacteriales bacterium]
MNKTPESNNSSLDSGNLLVLLYRWRKPIIIISAAAAIVSAGVSLLLEEKFKSAVVLFAVPQNSFGEQLLEEVKKEDVLAYGEEEDAERLLQIINSDKIRNRIIEKYDLWTHYNIPRDAKGANTLMNKEYNSNVTSRLTKFMSIEVEVLDKNPERARDMANDIAALTDTVSNQLRNERAMQAFQYAEVSYKNLQEEIKLLEDSMAALRRIGVYDYITQIEGLNEQYATAINEGRMSQANELKKQMDTLSQYGNVYTKLETMIESTYEREAILKKRYELMKIDVESKLPAKFVVDYASASDKKAYPIRWLIVAMSTASAFVLAFVFLLIWDNFKKLRTQGAI